jgi:hypothetical protein
MFDLLCITDREKFCVPFKSIGARGTLLILNEGVLDIPDEISFSECPVKYKSKRTILIRNIGEAPANFNLETTAPFKPIPTSAYLLSDKSMQIEIEFEPQQIGSFCSELFIKYATGEIMVVNLTGISENMDIRLEKTQLEMENTWITLHNSQIFKIVNKSDTMSHFKWKRFPNQIEEERTRSRMLIENSTQESKMVYSSPNKSHQLELFDRAISKRAFKV